MTSKSNVFSFGMFCWEVFSYGERPYKNMDNTEAVEFVKNGNRMDIPNNAPDIIKEVCVHFLYSIFLLYFLNGLVFFHFSLLNFENFGLFINLYLFYFI